MCERGFWEIVTVGARILEDLLPFWDLDDGKHPSRITCIEGMTGCQNRSSLDERSQVDGHGPLFLPDASEPPNIYQRARIVFQLALTQRPNKGVKRALLDFVAMK